MSETGQTLKELIAERDALRAACEDLVKICNRIPISASQEMRDEFALATVQAETALAKTKK